VCLPRGYPCFPVPRLDVTTSLLKTHPSNLQAATLRAHQAAADALSSIPRSTYRSFRCCGNVPGRRVLLPHWDPDTAIDVDLLDSGPVEAGQRKDAGRKNCSPNGIHSPVLVKVRADGSIQGHGHVNATIIIGSQPCQQDHQAGWGDSQLKGLLECSFK
jgi:hypothetical protein